MGDWIGEVGREALFFCFFVLLFLFYVWVLVFFGVFLCLFNVFWCFLYYFWIPLVFLRRLHQFSLKNIDSGRCLGRFIFSRHFVVF